MPDLFGRPLQSELRSSHLLALSAFVPVDEEVMFPSEGLAMRLRIASRSGSSVEEIAEVLEVHPERVEKWLTL